MNVWIDLCQQPMAGPNSPARAKRDQAKAAIREIGINALPSLLKMARAKDSALKMRILALAKKQSLIQVRFPSAEYYHARATCGFSALGPAARPAVPALSGLLRDPDRQVRASAAQCLSLIGPEANAAVPALIQALNAEGNGYGPVLLNSMHALGSIHAEPEHVVPLLLEYVNGPRKDWNYVASALDALGRYREKAKSAVPALLPYLNDPDEGRRSPAVLHSAIPPSVVPSHFSVSKFFCLQAVVSESPLPLMILSRHDSVCTPLVAAPLLCTTIPKAPGSFQAANQFRSADFPVRSTVRTPHRLPSCTTPVRRQLATCNLQPATLEKGVPP